MRIWNEVMMMWVSLNGQPLSLYKAVSLQWMLFPEAVHAPMIMMLAFQIHFCERCYLINCSQMFWEHFFWSCRFVAVFTDLQACQAHALLKMTWMQSFPILEEGCLKIYSAQDQICKYGFILFQILFRDIWWMEHFTVHSQYAVFCTNSHLHMDLTGSVNLISFYWSLALGLSSYWLPKVILYPSTKLANIGAIGNPSNSDVASFNETPMVWS